jgi:Family of unknown function (DUF6399)
MQALAETASAIAETWEPDARAAGEVREIIGGVDETFLERMMGVFPDLPTGSLVLEDVAEDRSYATWKAVVEARLKALGAEVLSLVSDRAKALMQLAENGLECLSMPDFFHVVHEIGTSYSLAIGQRLRQAHQERKQAPEALVRLSGRPHAAPADSAAKAVVEARQAEGTRWAEVHHTSRQHVEPLSLTRHPFHIANAAPQTSAQVESQLQATIDAIDAFAQRHQLPTRREAIPKVRKQVPALAALVDCWWQGVQQDLAPFLLSPLWRSWVHECLLPLVYGEHHAAHTRCARKKAKIRQTLEVVPATFHTPTITKQLAPSGLEEWKAWAMQRTTVLQRTSSAVEGRNGYLSQMHQNHRGLPRRRYKVWTIVHNFDCRAADGTTPASRFFRRTFPDLFETVLSHMEALPQPRRRKHYVALWH